LISLAVHAVLLGALATVRNQMGPDSSQVAVETVFSEERQQEEFTQELELDTTPAESLNLVAGGLQTTSLASAATTQAAKTKIDRSETLQEPQFRYNISDVSTPGLDIIGEDLGEGEVAGDVGARVEGYGAAMSRVTLELLRMMRQQQVMACWLFDESNSLKDDRREIRDQLEKLYEELNLATEQIPKGRTARYQPLETMVYGFGAQLHPLTPEPTADLTTVREAIDKVPHDESGKENLFGAIGTVVEEHGRAAARSKRKLVVIVLTDETGEDADRLEEVIDQTKRHKVPVYVLGREAIFGYPYGHVRWENPESGVHHWVRIDRGPETALPECLQYDGFRPRHDSHSSGFGPYAQVRLVRESGGIYFLLASREEDLVGRSVRRDLQRRFDDIAMKEYEPLLIDKREYVRRRDASEFRRTIWEVILTLNPHIDDELNIRWHHYPLDMAAFRESGKREFDRALRAMAIINQQIQKLERIEPLRAQEGEQRWRGAYDLILAQLMAYRVREFQFLLAMDRHAASAPRPEEQKSNYWDLRYVSTMLEPDERQITQTKVQPEQLDAQRQRAIELYEFVIQQHPGTPWAQVAAEERRLGFGIEFHDVYWAPSYFRDIEQGKVPKF
jgi:hypothetical protein